MTCSESGHSLSRAVNRVGIDFDGVLHDIHGRVCARIRDRHGVEFGTENITEWNVDLPTGGTFADEIGPVITSEDELHRTEMIPGAREGMQALADAGYTLVVTTHRPPSMHAAIREWLADREIPHHEFVENVPRNKGLVDIDLLIDDRPHNARLALAEDTHVIHFTGGWDGSSHLAHLHGTGETSDRVRANAPPVLRQAESWTDVCSMLDS